MIDRMLCGWAVLIALVKLRVASVRQALGPEIANAGSDFTRAKQTARRVDRICDLSPLPILCLTRAVAVRRRLHTLRIPSQVVFGYRPKSQRTAETDDAEADALITQSLSLRLAHRAVKNRNAHVWVNARDDTGNWQTIIGGEVKDGYAEIARFK